MPRPKNRFSIYDRMEAEGVFSGNPANPDSIDSEGRSLYKGPAEYPKMLYHPKGGVRVVNAGEEIDTPRGPKLLNYQEEMVSITVANADEEKLARAEGWHDHPAKAIAVRAVETGESVPEMGAQSIMASQEAEIRRLQQELERLRAEAAPVLPPSVLGKKSDTVSKAS